VYFISALHFKTTPSTPEITIIYSPMLHRGRNVFEISFMLLIIKRINYKAQEEIRRNSLSVRLEFLGT